MGECEDKALISVIHSNRAAVSIRLGEFAKAVDDCRTAIEADPSNVKALFRAGKASEELGLYGQAAGFCNEALRLAPADPQVRKLHASLKEHLGRLEEERKRKEAAAKAAERLKEACSAELLEALKPRALTLGPPLFDISLYAYRGPVVPKVVDGSVHWPIIFLYDEYGQSDFIESFDESCELQEQAQLMFPEDRQVDWDEEGKYVWHKLVAYLEVFDDESKQEDATKMIKLPMDEPVGG